ncbi:MAG: flagellar hook-length control protein FliK [Solirubrobacteraceae bacterium]
MAASAPTPTGSASTPAAALPGGTPSGATDQGAIAGEDPSQGPAVDLSTTPPDSARGRGAEPASDEQATANVGVGVGVGVGVAHNDARSLPTSPQDGELATPQGGAPTAAAAAPPGNESPAASAAPAPPGNESLATGAAPAPRDTTTVNGIASTLQALPNSASASGSGAQAHSTPGVAPSGDPIIPHSSATSSSHTNVGALAKTPGASTPAVGTSVDGIGGGLGGVETSSPLAGAALDGSPAASPAELGSGAYGVGLQEAIESLHGTIELAARHGLTQARISLQPEELGEIRINLTQTAQGLLARVSAESPVATQALAAAHAQLRQSLSSLGINLTRLDIAHHDSAQSGGADPRGNGQGGTARGEGFSGGRAGRSTAIATPADSETETDSPVAEQLETRASAPSHGTLIDVLA